MAAITEKAPPARPGHSLLPWWMAAGLVGADIGTSVFYSTGVLYPHVGALAPFFIGFVALCMWLFKLTYQEGCSVNPINGGAYSMVLATVGRRAALIVGSLTILSYLATAVVSALSGALYLSTLWPPGTWPGWLVVMVAAIPILVFGFLNLIGIKESTKLVVGIAAFHFSTLILIDVYGLFLAFTHGAHWERLMTGFGHLAPHAILLGFAGAFLGITGFETAAQITEEIEKPTHVAIRKIYLLIVALVSFTAPVSSLLVFLLLSDAQLAEFKNAFLSGLAYNVGGQPMLVVLVLNACFTLFAAVNTAFVGATGLMTTMGKQGNLPDVVLRQWSHRVPLFKGFPYVALSFAGLCCLMLLVFPGQVDRLGEVYGMAFLGVMVSYSLGVVLLRLHQPTKVERSPYKNKWTIPWQGKDIPAAAVLSMVLLASAETILFVTGHAARDLLVQLFLAVLLVMAYYRLGQVETRMVRLPDLRLGIGKYRGLETLPTLPTYLYCTVDASPGRIVTIISHLMRAYGPAIEVVLFHAESRETPSNVIGENLERLVSQQLEEFYSDKDLILAVKVLPGSLIEVLPEYLKTRRVEKVFISSGHDVDAAEQLKEHLTSELGIDVVRLTEGALPRGPAVWFMQWAQGFRRERVDFGRYGDSDSESGGTDNL